MEKKHETELYIDRKRKADCVNENKRGDVVTQGPTNQQIKQNSVLKDFKWQINIVSECQGNLCDKQEKRTIEKQKELEDRGMKGEQVSKTSRSADLILKFK